jgi:hypothetical protein
VLRQRALVQKVTSKAAKKRDGMMLIPSAAHPLNSVILNEATVRKQCEFEMRRYGGNDNFLDIYGLDLTSGACAVGSK